MNYAIIFGIALLVGLAIGFVRELLLARWMDKVGIVKYFDDDSIIYEVPIGLWKADPYYSHVIKDEGEGTHTIIASSLKDVTHAYTFFRKLKKNQLTKSFIFLSLI